MTNAELIPNTTDGAGGGNRPEKFGFVRDFVSLTKPKIILMLLVTAAG